MEYLQVEGFLVEVEEAHLVAKLVEVGLQVEGLQVDLVHLSRY